MLASKKFAKNAAQRAGLLHAKMSKINLPFMLIKVTRFFIILIFFPLLYVSGCATKPAMPSAGELHAMPWPERRAQLTAITHWAAQGALSINYGGKNTIANFAWQYATPNYAINIHSPMNLVNAHIMKDQSGITLITSTGRKAHAKTPELLMEQQLGWSLPLENLVYWIRALPAPEAADEASARQLDRAAHMIELQQQAWNITYGDFIAIPSSSGIDSVDLPTTIWLSAANVRIKIKITHWEL